MTRYQVTVETSSGSVSHVVRAADKRAAMERALRPYPGAMVIGLQELGADAPKPITKADRAQQETAVILRGRGYALADIAGALKISVDRALALLEAAE